jgi:2-polyprenyl-3-methyl-5-hydroxy-6-metoxy-1,4-benzoquinol methylase
MTENREYYARYEERYQKIYGAGIERWGHKDDDGLLCNVLKRWVDDYGLKGKSIIDFACGEGACGVILSKLGCRYHGVDISKSAVMKTEESIKMYPQSRVSLMNMVKETTGEIYDAAVDSMGLHMLVTDSDRSNYLRNAYGSLKHGATMIFFREMYGEDSYSGVVDSFDMWKQIKGEDFEELKLSCVVNGQEIRYPILPARGKTKADYYKEMESAGFTVEKFEVLPLNNNCSACIVVRKP